MERKGGAYLFCMAVEVVHEGPNRGVRKLKIDNGNWADGLWGHEPGRRKWKAWKAANNIAQGVALWKKKIKVALEGQNNG